MCDMTLALFITIIVLCFRKLGRTLQLYEDQPFAIQITIWSLGVALFTHVTSFISVSYFDQLILFWYLLLAMILGDSDSKDKNHDHGLAVELEG